MPEQEGNNSSSRQEGNGRQDNGQPILPPRPRDDEPTSAPKPLYPPADTTEATKEEAQHRVDMAIVMLQEGRRKSFIHKFFRVNYGIEWRQAERYMRRARDQMIAELDLTREELTANRYGWLMSVIADTKVDIRYKLEANKQITELLGLNAPKIVRGTVSETGEFAYIESAVSQLSIEELEMLDRIGSLAEQEKRRQEEMKRLTLEAESKRV